MAEQAPSVTSRLRLIATGGTISVRWGADGTLSRLTGADILKTTERIMSLEGIEVEDFIAAASFDLTIDQIFDLARRISAVAREGVAGIVVTHGTALMEEVAYAADILLDSAVPVVFTGSMRTVSELTWDGPRNLHDACRVAAAPEAQSKGAMIAFGGEIHAARDVLKVNNAALNPYHSPGVGPLGGVDKDGVFFWRHPVGRVTVNPARFVAGVQLVRVVAGLEEALFDALVAHGLTGLVVEGVPGGEGVPSVVAGRLRDLVEAGVPVVIASRGLVGRIRPPAKLRELFEDPDAPLMLAQQLSGPKARLLLMAGLGAGFDAPRLKDLFRRGGPEAPN